MKFQIGNIVEYRSDYLISSGNIFLNMSGGVNGELLARFGEGLQIELHSYLKDEGLKHVDPGFSYRFKSKIGQYKGVVYTVGIDGWYESNKQILSGALKGSIEKLNPSKGDLIAFPALGTGYGKMKPSEFGRILAQLDFLIEYNMVLVCETERKLNEIKQSYNTALTSL